MNMYCIDAENTNLKQWQKYNVKIGGGLVKYDGKWYSATRFSANIQDTVNIKGFGAMDKQLLNTINTEINRKRFSYDY